jgi:predicted deacetylase
MHLTKSIRFNNNIKIICINMSNSDTDPLFHSNLNEHKLPEVKFAIITIHDACPSFESSIYNSAKSLEALDIKYNIALIPFFNEKEDLPRFPDFVNIIKSCKAEIALHGLYHEKRNRTFDDFHTIEKGEAEEEIRAGLQIFSEIGIHTNVFIPPAWKLNVNSIKVLEKTGFRLAEIQEKFILLDEKAFKKITTPKVFNWDSTGQQEKNKVNIEKDRKEFDNLLKEEPKIIRIALHPRDPPGALDQQIEMINHLKDKEYDIINYKDLLIYITKRALLT